MVQVIPKKALNQEIDCDVSKLYNQLKQKEIFTQKLNCEIIELKKELERVQHERRSHHSMSVVNTVQRIERERDAAITKASTLHFECDALKEKLRVIVKDF